MISFLTNFQQTPSPRIFLLYVEMNMNIVTRKGTQNILLDLNEVAEGRRQSDPSTMHLDPESVFMYFWEAWLALTSESKNIFQGL